MYHGASNAVECDQWVTMERYHEGALPPEAVMAVELSSKTLALLDLRSLEIATDHLKGCGIVADLAKFRS